MGNTRTSYITTKTSHFKPFPNFTKLDSNNRAEYQEITSHFPPIANISFETLKLWWDDLDNAEVSILHGNLVVSYWSNGGDEEQSGLCLIGENNIDQSICHIFDYQRQNSQRARLFYVPEFVIHNIKHPDMFYMTSNIRDDEYVLELARFADIKKLPIYQRSKMKQFMRKAGTKEVKVSRLDLRKSQNRLQLLESARSWPKKGFNKLGSMGDSALIAAVQQAGEIGIENLCITVDSEVQAFLLYTYLNNSDYIAVHNARINYDLSGLFDYMTYAFAKDLCNNGVKYANLHSDLNIPHLRALKLTLRPVRYFRKFTIEPAL